MFSRIRISTSFFLLLILICTIQLISSGLSFTAFRSDYQNLNRVDLSSQQRDALSLSWVSLLQARNTLNRAGTRSALKVPQEQVNALMGNARSSLQKADLYFNQFLAVPRLDESDTGGELLEATKNSYQNLRVSLRQLIDFLEAGNLQAFMDQPTQKTQDLFEADFLQYLQYANEVIAEAGTGNQQAYHLSMWIFGGAILMVIAMAISSLIWLRTMFVNPLKIMRSHFDRIAQGDLSGQIDVSGRNEISQMFASLRTMQHSLITTVSHVRDGTQSMLTGIQEISAGNNDLSARTEQQAASLEQTAASMEQLTATVKQNADNARQATQLAQNASGTAAKGGELAGSVVTTMHAIETSSKKIGAIISVIDGIAFQTNILALNAAVEAARAGEQGRGFAVVAGEVRNLAQRSAQAAKEIKVLIEESVSRVSQGSTLVENAGTTMEEIVRSVTRVTDIMGEIASASDEQSRGIEQVSLAVTQMDQVTQQNAALVEEAAAAANALEEQASLLSHAVSVFRLEQDSDDGEGHAAVSSGKQPVVKEIPDCQTA
ncbi:methyl-accepting chemotaxis protein [Yersinia massiliensis]|jgi:methyl-accepting chemotaxis protein-4 (peptide sensor receptor)|uniref:Methyl-accepting chemotaxis protein n=2 Tax=Yersinia TaxID=629 RepID=A0AAI8ZPE3_YERFR|nr:MULTISPECIES: methyl-accepting chemotaxis protein [Yersinia]HEC1648554.1 Tar ligand binding domain-containing protein [Yersinia enterocolitica]ATM86327.1 methyl-accepting chemotaxis protein [Yersinia frederiksenii]MCB5317223.1 methyl-accepting chemotaxis protein [Yersinia massiliensis]MDA5546636.1 methyl-accepting chemotaxis protein [Yersinia massiliensis]MDN0126735.1 methyl-accepting chemotaxis protein [Yersinia massiliensis]